jgi:hypothetical protein
VAIDPPMVEVGKGFPFKWNGGSQECFGAFREWHSAFQHIEIK